MKLFRLNPKKSKAQAMVEFAIALPILLLVVYGLIETGRLLFIFSSVNNTTRQAVRYGSSSGVGPNGVARYLDCVGIRATAQDGDFLNAFDDADIFITYDNGEAPYTQKGNCNGTSYSGATLESGDRILVTVNADFNPIVPNLVPFIARTVDGGDPIVASSARTLLLSITIQGPATPTFTPSPTPTPSKTPTITNTPSPTFTPEFTYTPSLTPTITPIPSITNTPTMSLTPTGIPTNAPCAVSHGDIEFSGANMSMTITNSTSQNLAIQDVTVFWNSDTGSGQGNGDLGLIAASLEGYGTFWQDTGQGIISPSYTITPTGLTIPPGTWTIFFKYKFTYTIRNGSERILINLSTPGCTFIDSAQ